MLRADSALGVTGMVEATRSGRIALANALAQQEAARARADQREIDTAGEIQKVLLPDRDPQIEGFAIAGKNIPARRLSGDYFDFMPLPDGRFGAVIADVSGKGMPAALITVTVKSSSVSAGVKRTGTP